MTDATQRMLDDIIANAQKPPTPEPHEHHVHLVAEQEDGTLLMSPETMAAMVTEMQRLQQFEVTTLCLHDIIRHTTSAALIAYRMANESGMYGPNTLRELKKRITTAQAHAEEHGVQF